MKKNTILLLCFLICSFYIVDTQAQYLSEGSFTTLKARMIHKDTKKPIPFVNVGFIGKGIGSVTNAQGYFELTYLTDKIKKSDVIQFSIIGFKTKQIPIASISSLLSKNNTITLVPERYSLEEIVLGDTKIKNTTIGNTKIDLEKFGYWKNELGLGGEIASKIKIKKKQTQLKSLNFTVLENLSDSIRVRVNIYNIDPIFRIPQKNILNTTIYHTVSRSSGVERIPLSKYKIFTDTDVIVSIELIEIYGERLGFAVAGSGNKNASFTRPISQDYWESHKKQAMGFTIDVSYPLEKGTKETIDRPLPEAVTIFWDASAKAKNRNLYSEIELIERYLKALKNIDVTVHKFAFGYKETKDFTVKKGKSEAIINYLEDTSYEGTSDYSALTEVISKKLQYTIIFTEGNALFSDLQPVFSNTTFTVSTSKKANKEVLEDIALYTDGIYLDLNARTPKKAVEYLLKEVGVDPVKTDVYIPKVIGTITSEIGPLDGARIAVQGTFNEVISDASGIFEIKAEEGDKLEIRFPGMKSRKVQVTTGSKMNITLETSGDWLNEVVVTGENKSEKVKKLEAIDEDYKNKSYSSKVITKEDIEKATTHDLVDLISGRVSGIATKGQYPNRVIVNRRDALDAPLGVLLDGVLHDQSILAFINTSNLYRIEVINSPGNAVDGTGGYIKITTLANAPPESRITKKPSALVEGNNYVAEDVVVLNNALNKPVYLIQLERATTLEEANTIYEQYKNTELEDPVVFYTDVATYFKKWDKNRALRILSNLPEALSGNIEVLKLMAYHLESFKEDQLANTLYKKILELAPDRIQSYRDLAISYQQVGKYQEAFELYKQILANETVALDFLPLKKTAEFEMMRLLTFHKSKVSFQDVSNELLAVGFKKDRRLVFEWTNPQADFEIQFVNPKGKYFTWEHSVFTNQERLKDEVSKGYSIEEFALDDAPPGEWVVNVQYLGKEGIQPPSYLKYTLYLNYATSQETKEVKLIKLFQQKDKTTVGTLTLR
jgi:tetratricopeptide (TPR) repeat protein